MGWRDRRSPRGWERDLLREIRALETTDVEHDGPVSPVRGRMPRPARRRFGRASLSGPNGRRPLNGERRRTVMTLAITCVLVVAVASISLGPAAPAVRRLIGMGPVGGGDGHSYAFIRFDRNGDPAAFSPCKDIHFEVNPSQAPSDWQPILDGSIDAVSAATGLTFVDDGTTDDDDYFDRRSTFTDSPESVLIGWTTADRIHDLDGDVAGVTSSDFNPSSNHYDTGRVVLDADAYDELEDQPGGRAEEQAILMHELGHLVGLAHVDDPHELMYPTVGTQLTYGTGDLAGLKRIGQVHC